MPVKLSPLALVAACLLFMGCPTVEPVTEAPQPAEPADPVDVAPEPVTLLDFEIIADGSHSPVGPAEQVYRTAEEWQGLEEGLRDIAYSPRFPEDAVLLAAIDANTGGFRVVFDSVYVMPSGGVAAVYTVEQPGADCMVTQALTQPFQVIAVPRLSDDAVRFIQRRVTYSC